MKIRFILIIFVLILSIVPTYGMAEPVTHDEFVVVLDSPERANITSLAIEQMGGEIIYVKSLGVGRIYTNISEDKIDCIEQLDGVLYVTRPASVKPFMSLISLADFMGIDVPQLAGFTGTGIMGEVQDLGIDDTSFEFDVDFRDWEATDPIHNDPHGNHVFSPVFSKGISYPNSEGALPDATTVFSNYATNKENLMIESVNHLWNGQFTSGIAGQHGLFQVNSWGHVGNGVVLDGAYDHHSEEIDSAANLYPKVLTLWATGNGVIIIPGDSPTSGKGFISRDSASKNGLSVGGIIHYETSSTSDDKWAPFPYQPNEVPSRGPSKDNRQKPDVVGAADSVLVYDNSNFNGVSAANAIVGGITGQTYEMYIVDCSPHIGQ